MSNLGLGKKKRVKRIPYIVHFRSPKEGKKISRVGVEQRRGRQSRGGKECTLQYI